MILSEERITKKIISLNIDLISYQAALARIITLGKSKTQGYICFANVHMTIEAYENKAFASQVNNASLVLADGMPIVKSLKYIHGEIQDRVAGMDAFPDLLKLAEENAMKVFFFGSTPELLEKIKFKTAALFPNLKIAGSFSPPFDRSLDDESYVDLIKASDANLVFIALGCPKQERWMAIHSHKINAPLLGVGGAFPVYAGLAKRAPYFLQRLSLEWLYRLLQEPRRLFKRYFKTNTLFLYQIMKIKMKGPNAKGNN